MQFSIMWHNVKCDVLFCVNLPILHNIDLELMSSPEWLLYQTHRFLQSSSQKVPLFEDNNDGDIFAGESFIKADNIRRRCVIYPVVAAMFHVLFSPAKLRVSLGDCPCLRLLYSNPMGRIPKTTNTNFNDLFRIKDSMKWFYIFVRILTVALSSLSMRETRYLSFMAGLNPIRKASTSCVWSSFVISSTRGSKRRAITSPSPDHSEDKSQWTI